MAIIPLPRRSSPLPNVASPVLDRERRPTVDTRQQEQALGQLADASKMPEIPMALGKDPGLQAIGQALAQGGDALGAVALKRVEAETHAQVSEGEVEMQRVLTEFNSRIQTSPNLSPSMWGKEFQEYAASARERILGREGLTPAAKEDLQLRFNRWQVLTGTEVEASAQKAIFGRAKAATLGSIENAIEAGSLERFEAARNDGVSKGYLFDFEAEHLTHRFKEVSEQRKKKAKADAFDVTHNSLLAIAVGRGEEAAIAELEHGTFGKLEPLEQERLRSSIRTVTGQRSADAMEKLVTGIYTGGINSEAGIDAVESPHLTPAVRLKAKEELRRRDLQAEAEDRRQNGVRSSVELFQTIKDLQRTGDPAKDSETFFTTLAEIKRRVPENTDGVLTQLLSQKMFGKPPELKPREEIMTNLRDTLSDMFDPEKGAIKWRRKEVQKVQEVDSHTGKTVERWKEVEVIDEDAKRRSMDAQTRVLQKLNQWGEMHPHQLQDLDKAKEQFLKFLPEGAVGGALNSLQKFLPPRPAPATGGRTALRGFVPADDLAGKLPAGLQPHAQDFIDAGREYGLNPRVLAAISALETAGGTSKAFREKQNAMGISDRKGPVAMASVRESIFQQARTLARTNGPYARARTLEEIGRIYAPPGAENDFHGTNSGWAQNVNSWLARL